MSFHRQLLATRDVGDSCSMFLLVLLVLLLQAFHDGGIHSTLHCNKPSTFVL